MRIAIHHKPGTFSDEWLRFCKLNEIDVKIVNCYDSDIVNQLSDCDGLMWHWSQTDTRAVLFAKQLVYSLESKGLSVFPDSNTSWHFDDKVGQKYLLEATGSPLVPAYVFYDKRQAKEWVKQSSFPKVFKLRGGASSVNVKIVRNKSMACRLIRKSFGKGFSPVHKINRLKDKFRKFRRSHDIKDLVMFLKGIIRLLSPSYDDRMLPREKGYVYFQDFIPDNTYDIRLVVIGKRAFGLKRLVRENDFRASGSGNFTFLKEGLPLDYLRIAFSLAEKLKLQSGAFDFVLSNGKIMLLELSYGFISDVYKTSSGFWDSDLNWHEEKFVPEWFIMEDFIAGIKRKGIV